jgi:replicative DNA helicase
MENNNALFDYGTESKVLVYVINYSNYVNCFVFQHNIKPEYFYSPQLRDLSRVILECLERKMELRFDFLNEYVRTRLKKVNGRKLSKDGREELLQLLQVLEMQPFQEIDLIDRILFLRELQQKRIVQEEICEKVTDMLPIETVEHVVSYINEKMGKVAGVRSVKTMKDHAQLTRDEVLRAQKGGKSPVLKTGIDAFDKRIGLRKNRYITIAALPSVGKTLTITSMLNGLFHYQPEEIAVLFFSLDMKAKRITQNLYSELCNLTTKRLEGEGIKLTPEEIDRLMDATTLVSGYNLEIIDSTLTMEEMYAETHRFWMKNRDKHLVVILDHTKKVLFNKPSMRDQIIQVSHTIYRITNDFDSTSLVLSQLNTKELLSEKYRAILHKPNTSFIAESSNIEEDSDTVILEWRPSLYMGKELPEVDELWMIVEKNRGDQNKFEIVLPCIPKYYSITNPGQQPGKNYLKPT